MADTKIIPARFVEGRDHYTNRVPLLQVMERGKAISGEVAEANAERSRARGGYVKRADLQEPEDHVFSFAFGFLDGVLRDIRDCAENARDEMSARKADTLG